MPLKHRTGNSLPTPLTAFWRFFYVKNMPQGKIKKTRGNKDELPRRGNGSNLPPVAGPGRPKGVPNKSTTLAREAISRLVDGNVGKFQKWLDAIAADEKHGPSVAFKLLLDVMEYHIPKLARTEHTGKDGESLTIEVVNFVVKQ